jgi:ATP-dependent DNA helicase RecG
MARMKEHQRVEWKESWRDEYLKWLCGFANADGGVLVIGRDDQGKPIGVANAEKLLEDLPNEIRDVLGIMPDVRLLKKSGKELLEIRVEPYPSPISYKGEYFYRSGSTKQELKGAALDRFLLRKHGRTWDGAPWPGVSVRDLSKAAIQDFRKRARESGRVEKAVLREPVASLLEKLHLVEGKYLKRAAVLLFHEQPERVSTGAYVKVGFFRNNVDLLYHDEIHGDLFTQADKTVDLIRTKYLKAGIRYEGLQRIETYPVPEDALREAVVNAIIHKDYAAGATIQIRVFADKLEIWNPGQLPPDWTVAKLLGRHSSQPFNPDVANAFFRAGEIEAWGQGIDRMITACREAGFPKPEIESEQAGLWVNFPFPPEIVDLTDGGRRGGKRSPDKGGLGEKLGEKLGETRAAIVTLMRQDSKITTTQLAERVGMSATAMDKNLQYLKSHGYIRRVGPAKGGYWEVLE